MKYFVSPPDETTWRLDREEFVSALRRHWLGVEACYIDKPNAANQLEWSVRIDGQRLDGWLDCTGDTVVLDAGLRGAAKFAIWLRSLAPSEQPLLFFDEGYSGSTDLTADTSEDHLLQAIPSLIQS